MTRTKKILIAFLLLSILGFINTGYLTYHAIVIPEIPLPCSIFSGCDEVARSPYSKVFGFPLSMFGLLFYFGMLGLSALALGCRCKESTLLLRIGAWVGFLFSLYFLYLQAFVIKAYCLYCLLSAAISIALLALSFFLSSAHPEELTDAKILLK